MIAFIVYSILGTLFLGYLFMEKSFRDYETSVRKKSKTKINPRTNYK